MDANNSAKFKLSPLIENCLFYKNVAIWKGGGINKVGGGVTFIVRGCQFIENKVTKRYGAGINFLNPFGDNVIEDCVFERDTALNGEGGGLSYETTEQNSILKLINTNFKDNYASTSGPVLRMFGNGLFGKRGTHTAIIKNCDFDNNFSHLGSGGVFTIANFWNKYVINIEECTFTNNYARNGGGSIYSQTNFDSILLTINKCVFQNNSGVTGFDGNIFLRPNAPQKINYHSLQISNSLFTGNGGAVSVFASGGNADTKINNCTFYNNGFTPIVKNWLPDFEKANRYNTMEFTNSIIYEQEVPTIEGLFFNNNLDSVHLTDYILKNCWISTLPSEDYVVDETDLIFDKYPLFRDAENGDFSLKYCSPAINAGDNQFSFNVEEDIFGNPRVINEIIDIGAIENDPIQEETLIDTLINLGETIQIGAFTFDEPGTYFIHLENENGCDSLIRLNLDFTTATYEVRKEDLQIALYPNPTTSITQLHFQTPERRNVQIRVLDYTGRQLQQQQIQVAAGKTTTPIELPVLSGIYWIQVLVEQQKGQYFRVVKL